MDAVSYSLASKQAQRIEKFIKNPDSNSGIVTVPKVIGAGESVTIPAGRVAVLPNVQVEGEIVVESGAEIFVPAGAGFGDLDQRIDRLETLQIGAILNGYTIFDNCIVAFGGEFNRADYPKLWAYLQANPTLVKTQAQWQTESTANGGICGFYSSGNGTTTFRVPNLDKAFLRPDNRSVGSYQGDAIRNITGNFTGRRISDIGGEGALYRYNTGYSEDAVVNSEAKLNIQIGFDASRVVPTANENRPKNIAVLPLIVAK